MNKIEEATRDATYNATKDATYNAMRNVMRNVVLVATRNESVLWEEVGNSTDEMINEL